MVFDVAARCALVLLGSLGLAACSALGGRPLADYQPEAFGASMYTRHYLASPAETCEAARRALLSQGYLVNDASTDQVTARKYFQPDTEHHVQIEFRIVCAPEGAGQSVAFASATQDQYLARSANNSASVGVGGIGSLSLPLQGGPDSLVKIGSKTVTQEKIYDRLFALMGGYLSTVVSAHESESPAVAAPGSDMGDAAAHPAPPPEL